MAAPQMAAAQTGAAAPAERQRIVRVREGALAGREAGGVVAFKGVRYAAPPVGPFRFRPPAPPQRWEGVRSAAQFGPAPVQPGRCG